ncbi:MAG TPA: FISUMP domain-containing protein, partial [Bacteroidales bacterium]|nr:FISUMP domain-containing protein [Bacteroidales bacterium]
LNGCVDSARVTITSLPSDSVYVYDTLCQGDSLYFAGSWLSLGGVYTDKLINANGCDSMVTLELTVVPLPWGLGPLTLSHPDSLCENEAALLLLGNTQPGKEYALFDAYSGAGFSSPQYGNGASLSFTIPAGSTGSLYYFLVSDTLSGCMRDLDTLISFTVSPLPVIGITADTGVCEGEMVSLLASGGQSYVWNTLPPQLTPSITVISQGVQTFSVTVTRFGCVDSAEVTVTSLPVYRDTLRDTICEGESVPFAGTWISTGGVYPDTLVSSLGCDSITTLILIVDPLPYGLAGPVGPSPYCISPMTDPRDGRSYPVVQIGTQCWMGSGLNYGIYRSLAQGQANNGIAEKHCYDNIPANCDLYGGLYSWNEAMAYAPAQTQGLCPLGWHIPTDEEWKVLEGNADNAYPAGHPVWNTTSFRGQDAGMRLKTIIGWSAGGQGTNATGFSAYASGQSSGNSFLDQGLNAWYWTSTPNAGGGSAWVRNLRNSENRVNRTTIAVSRGLSVRCLRDIILPPPTALTLDYTDTLCPYDSGLVWLGNTQAGVEYTLYDTNTLLGYSSPQYGNGDTLTFVIPAALTGGSYAILAVDTLSRCERLLDTLITFTVNPLPVPLVSPDTTLCDGNSVTLQASGGSSYQWSGGPATPSWTVSPALTTTYHVTVSEQGCTETDSVTVSVTPLPWAQAGPDTALCAGDSVQLFSSGGTSYQWSPSAGLTSVTQPDPMAWPATSTQYVVTVTALGCSAADTVNITVDPMPQPQTTPDTVICAGTSITLTTSGGVSYAWSTTPVQNQASIQVSPLNGTLYHVTITSGACIVTDSVMVGVTALPVPYAGADTAICLGDTAQLLGSGGGAYAWGPAASLSTPSQAGTLAWPTLSTVYTLTVTANGCSASDAVSVLVTALPPANAGPNVAMCAGDSVQLTASGGTSYAWSHGPMTASTWVHPTTTTAYVVTVTSGNCSATDQVTVTWKPLPQANAGSDDTLCLGGSVPLTASG